MGPVRLVRWLVPVVAVLGSSAVGTWAATGIDPSEGRLVTDMPVTSLAAAGSTVGFATGTGEPNEGAVYLWAVHGGPAIRRGTAVADNGLLGEVAVTGRRELVWIKGNETNHLDGWVLVAPFSRRSVHTLYSRTDVDLPRHVAADGGIVVFTTDPWVAGKPSMVWVGTTRKVKAVWKTQAPIDDVAVEGKVVAVALKGAGVEVFRTTGEHVLTLGRETASGGLEIDRGRLVLIGQRRMSTIGISTGRTLRSWPMSRGSTLLDVQGDLAVYRSGNELRVRRLSDGRTALIPTGAAMRVASPHARFEASGIVIASGTVVRFMPKEQLARLLAG